MDILWDPYESPWYTCKILNDIVTEFPESHDAICFAHSRPKLYKFEYVQMDSIASLRGVFLPKWHAICSMHNTYTLIDTLRNAKVHTQTSMVQYKFCILCNFHALSVQYIAVVPVQTFIILVCSHAIIVDRAALGFWQWCHLGIHGVRHRLLKHTSILVVCVWQEEVYYIYIYIMYIIIHLCTDMKHIIIYQTFYL